ncbi:MAG TPA: hypothetical protein DEB31_10265 [Clostridiales bacterium]|nr:hypothetical protein [Clostridiales bacterium]
MQSIYLDNAATTRPLAALAGVYEAYARGLWQNPSALYAPAVGVQNELNEARGLLLSAFGGEESHRCLFTSGGTEGANTVVFRGARGGKQANYVCGGAEHPCVEESFKSLYESGAPVKWVKPDGHGNIAVQDVLDAVDGHTALVCVMHVNNETGAKNDVAAIAAAVKAKNPRTLFFADGVQAYLREAAEDAAHIDYYTVSAHKTHALKGTGALFYKKGAPLRPYLLGGGQEGALRSGTQNTFGILCFRKAVEYFLNEKGVAARLEALRRAFLNELGNVPGMVMVTPNAREKRCSHIVNIAFEAIRGETLLHTLEAKGIYISTGAACSSKKGKSRIAKALSLPDTVAEGAVRVSFSPFNTEEEAAAAAGEMKKEIARLRKFTRK